MKTCIQALAVCLMGAMIGSISLQNLFANEEDRDSSLWDAVVSRIQYAVDLHDQDPGAHPGKGGLHVIDANGVDRGVPMDAPSSMSMPVVFDTAENVIYRLNYLTGETWPLGLANKFYLGPNCQGDWYICSSMDPSGFSAGLAELVYDSQSSFSVPGSKDAYKLGQPVPPMEVVSCGSFESFPGTCEDLDGECYYVHNARLTPVELPELPAPLHLDIP